MKIDELKKMSPEDRKTKEAEVKMELLKINGQVATGTTPKNPGRIRQLKRIIARIRSLE